MGEIQGSVTAEKKLLELLQELAPLLDGVVRAIPIKSTFQEVLLKAAVGKCFEFCCYIFDKEETDNFFFAIPALRGICEDLIALNYFAFKVDSADREILLQAFFNFNFLDALKRQTAFFQANRPFQPVLTSDRLFPDIEEPINISKQEIRQFKSKYRWKRSYPTVEEMSEAVGLRPVYDYLYAATSRAVHFTPSTLFRMGWTTIPKKDVSRQEIGNYEMYFSTKNFGKYYQEFCEFYSVTLLVQFLTNFNEVLELPSAIQVLTEQIAEQLRFYVRWPELVTFEEMNLRGPSQFIYLMASVAQEIKDKEGADEETSDNQ